MHQSRLFGSDMVVLCLVGPAERLKLSEALGIGTKDEHLGAWRRGSRQGMAKISKSMTLELWLGERLLAFQC